MLKCNEKVTQTSGLEWLLKNDPSMRRTGAAIRNVGALARRLAQFQDRPCGFFSIDEEKRSQSDESGEHEGIHWVNSLMLDAEVEVNELEAWRLVEMGADLEALLFLAREEGTRGLAKRLGCTQRSIQQKLKKLVEEGVEADMFYGENQHA